MFPKSEFQAQHILSSQGTFTSTGRRPWWVWPLDVRRQRGGLHDIAAEHTAALMLKCHLHSRPVTSHCLNVFRDPLSSHRHSLPQCIFRFKLSSSCSVYTHLIQSALIIVSLVENDFHFEHQWLNTICLINVSCRSLESHDPTKATELRQHYCAM